MLRYFDGYVKIGFKPIAIYKNTKCPIGKKWNKNWSASYWRSFFEDSNDFNLGILLGDIVDVEGDTAEANILLNKLIGNVPHPKFSSSKSIHHLFLTPDQKLTRFTCDGIEFRGHNHQSVVPPSNHLDGTTYKWLQDSKFHVPPMPHDLLEYYLTKKREKFLSKKYKSASKNKQGYIKTKCNCCKKDFFIHMKRLTLEVRAFQQHKMPWLCRGCRKIDIRDECRFIRSLI